MDLAPWQLPFDIASKHPSVHPTARHLSGTLSDATDVNDLFVAYAFGKGQVQVHWQHGLMLIVVCLQIY